MIEAKEIQKNLTEEQVILVLNDLGSCDYKRDSDNNLIFQSICHGSNSFKLYYFPQTKSFFCYKDWESYNIFNLVMKVKDITFFESIKYICTLLNISLNSFSTNKQGFGSKVLSQDWDIFNRYTQTDMEQYFEEEMEIFNPNILNLYEDYYYKGWVEEFISVPAMKKFNIKYDSLENRIIIPHYNLNNDLIGIRSRNLDKDAFAKYAPVKIEEKWYSHCLSNNLYGLNKNIDNIIKTKKIMICESEKAVLQAESYFPDKNFVVACCGSFISNAQIQILLQLQIREVILGFDHDYENIGDEKWTELRKKILMKAKKLMPYFTVYIIEDTSPRLLGYKDSPTDKGKETLLSLMKNKTLVTEDMLEKK